MADSEERRTHPRLEVLGRIHGGVVALDVPLTLLNMSAGGLSVQTPFRFPIGATHDFRFKWGDHAPIVLRAQVVHTLRATREGEVIYVTGLEFTGKDRADIQQAIKAVMDVLSQPVDA